MSKITNRDTAPRDGGSVEQRLARLLDTPLLARIVPHLPPETLHQLIRYRGLDACGELVTSATPTQLTSVLDLDLWRHARPGRDEQFDVERFAEWVEVLVDAGESVAARTVAALDANLVVEGLSRYVRVLDPGIFEPIAQSDDERPDRHESMREGDSIHADAAPMHGSSDDRPECEVGGYIVRARRADAWDAIIALLVALDAEQGTYFQAVMQGCRRLSNSRPEVDGLDDLLMTPEQHLHDVASEREQRRSQQGYATPADARAFLQMARQPRMSRNPIVTAYFRAADGEAADSTAVSVRDTDDGAYRRSRELAFLANTLLAGCSVQSRSFTPEEASAAAASICSLGFESRSDSVPHDSGLVTAFEVGWSVLYQDVSLFVARELISILAQLRVVDRDVQRGLVVLRRTLKKHCDAGTPWLVRGAAEVLAELDMTAWVSVLGLLDECPVVPAALTAILDGRTTTVSPTAFDFISTAAQVDDIRVFMRRLPDLLTA